MKKKPDDTPLTTPESTPANPEPTNAPDDAAIPTTDEPVAPVAPETDQATLALTDQIAELTNDLQRTRADFENFRKQVEAQRLQAISVAKYATIEQFLPLIDDMDRAIAAYPDQLQPLAKSFQKTLDSLHLAKINSAPGTEFNPDYHEAVSVDDEGGDVDLISETLRPGYTYDGNIIRAAMVKVKR